MNPVRHLALWLAAAIVMIAVSLMPSVASAHAGHGAAPIAADGSAVKAASLSAQIVKAHAAKAEARLLCSGPCCLPSAHACSSCCSAGLMPAAELTLNAPLLNCAALAHDLPSPPGIVPEALPEPPRPLA